MWRFLITIGILVVLQSVNIEAVFKGNLFKEPPVPEPATDRRFVGTEWIYQPLDHFNPQDLRIWPMRYHYNMDYFTPGSPMFIMVGGEWTISEGWLMGGHMYYMAQSMNGSMYYTEHRYYGRSHPTSDATVDNMRFLNIDQALADLAYFITEQKRSTPGMENSPVIMVGGSYAGTMVAWFRKKYPHLVDGVWASSAPVLAQIDFIEYKEIVGESIALVGGQQCHDRLQRAFTQMEEMIANNETDILDDWFQICGTLANSNELSLWTFFSDISDMIAGVVQYHWPGDIEGFCDDILTDDTDNDVQALARWVQSYIGSRCLEHDYHTVVSMHLNDDWSNPINYAGRQWFYQTCAEYGWYQTSGSENQPFGSSFPVYLYVAYCFDIFGTYFDAYTLGQNIKRTNIIYGGLDLEVSNVLFTHGHLDPWRGMGIQEDLNPSAPAVVIPNASHCQDLQAMSPNDSEEMTAAKTRIIELVEQWVEQANARKLK